jgi:hypothetical protein
MASDSHDDLVCCSRFRQFGDGLMPQIVEPKPMQRAAHHLEIGVTSQNLVLAGGGGPLK